MHIQHTTLHSIWQFMNSGSKLNINLFDAGVFDYHIRKAYM